MLVFVGIPAILAAAVLTSCEDDPILAPQKGGKKASGSYGNIAVAPPVDSLSGMKHRSAADIRLPQNPELY